MSLFDKFRQDPCTAALRLLALGGLALFSCFGTGCAMVHQKDREWLSDPVMQRSPDALESGSEGEDYPRREGATGGSSGAGGGCGC